ncbi:RdgB/HAM1 family non-canonical purine NTP pyrophosphatase [Pseudolysinimonas yzui]|uniref:dITP/XTP pyrophosphatase n=1 Tax=Pseudolysinimonas yzui TaxID=2708254 RepID=A0A8J3DSD0_9MICO|nr:RdgB/HAM1 family non-canonical purine NTP pyrophosphatase [Pseudolysinimonas yzui]GHF04027.1 non-canonical purine NTP pyrophosphatase [Pseudolysinimonas yzui]
MTTFVLATHNAHKVQELRRILGDRLGPHDLIGYVGPAPIEDGDSFEANALIKARAAHAHTGLPALADDSGIAVAALGGAPGIDSAHYSGSRDDGANLRHLLAELGGVNDRSAHFVCAAALVDAEGEYVVRGEWPGTVLTAPAGHGGFGYDPVFRPDGESRSAAELTPAEKDADSHRARAFVALTEELRRRYG